MRQPVQARSRRSADRVLEATLEIVAAEGVAGVTTAKVAARSGTSNGTIYHRFGSRRALLTGAFALFQRRLEDRARRTAAGLAGHLAERARDAPPGEALELTVAALVDSYVRVFERDGPLIRAFFLESLGDPDIAGIGETGKAVFADRIRAAVQPYEGLVTAPDLDVAVRVIHRLLFGHCMMRLLFHDEAVPDVPTRDALRAAVIGVLRPVASGEPTAERTAEG